MTVKILVTTPHDTSALRYQNPLGEKLYFRLKLSEIWYRIGIFNLNREMFNEEIIVFTGYFIDTECL